MGINGLNKFLKKYEGLHTPVHLSMYQYEKIAVDTSGYLYKYKAGCGEDWFCAFINLVICLRKNNIHCVFVYDTSSPIEKQKEREKRKEKKQDLENTVNSLENALLKYKSNEASENDINLLENVCKKDNKPRLIGNNKNINIIFIEEYIQKKKLQIINITPKDIEMTKELLSVMGVPYLDANMEAETLCAHLCKTGQVKAVISDDTDALAYNTPIVLNKVDTSSETCIEVKSNIVQEKLELTYSEFLDFCIMCGTDYNDNIKGIGPVNAYNKISQYKSIDNIPLSKEQKDILNHNRVRELFLDYQKDNINISYCELPDWQEVSRFMFENNCRKVRLNLLRDFLDNRLLIES